MIKKKKKPANRKPAPGNKGVIFGIIGLVLTVGIAAALLNNPTDQPLQEIQNISDQIKQPENPGYTIALPEQNASGESGTAVIKEENGKVKVELRLSDAPEGVVQPAHIHVGACPQVGDVQYALTSVEDGWSETILDVTLDDLRSQLPLGINVHKSEAEPGIYVACGDITL